VALQFEARKVALKQDRTGYVLTLSLHPDEIPDDLLRDFVGARYACALVRINDDESPVLYDNRTQKAAILCKSELFQRFMGCATEDGAAGTLCVSLGIQSRTELHGNKDAQAKFDQLLKDYEDANDPFA
jgi:hypothetical protein